jgi:hypothetical protein
MRGGHRLGGALAIAGGLLVMAGCGRYVTTALASGTTTGRLGAVYAMPHPSYIAGVAAGVLGIGMGAFLVRMGWRWLRGDRFR